MTVTYQRPQPPPGPLARRPEEQPRSDGSVHAEQHCHECGASSHDVPVDPVIWWNPDTHAAEYRFACAGTDCRLRTAGVTA